MVARIKLPYGNQGGTVSSTDSSNPTTILACTDNSIQVRDLFITNVDTDSIVITIAVRITSTNYILIKECELLPNQSIVFTAEDSINLNTTDKQLVAWMESSPVTDPDFFVSWVEFEDV